VRVVTAQPQAQQRLKQPQIPSQKQPMRGLSPHPPPHSPTRGEGSKTVKPCAQLPGENSANRPRSRARFSPSPAGGRGGRGVRVVTAQTPAHKHLTHTDRTLSPTRGDGSKTVKPRARLPGENSANRPRARARFSPSPAGGRGGRGVRVVTAQTQAHHRLTNPDPHSKPPTTPPPQPRAKAALARSFPSPPAPLPDPGRGEQNSKKSRAVTR
jgi:hypothetical protein